jgi:CHAT domain-containing protein
LTLSEVLGQARARRTRDGGLVILGACSSDLAIADHDEALTLASAFMAAGATGVVDRRGVLRLMRSRAARS